MGDHRWYIRGRANAAWGMVCLAGIVTAASGADPEALSRVAQSSVVSPSPGDAAQVAKVEVKGAATPGSRVRLQVEDPGRPGRHYLWFQTEGPPVDLNGRSEPELKVTIPPGAEELGFLLVVGDEHGLREASVTIPVLTPSGSAAEALARGDAGPGEPRANAGDDQIGLVGRRITLNASGSTPTQGLDYRWIQVGGPEVESVVEAAKFLSFIPKVGGRYRFGLVVAHENRISAPDYATVDVGLMVGTGPSPGSATPAVASPLLPLATGGGELDAIVGSALASLDDAPSLVGQLAEAFEATALRLDLYKTSAELFGELTRRMDTIVPKDPTRRARWNTAFFEPLTRLLIAQLLPLGLDLRTTPGYVAPLTDLQKQEVRGQFQHLVKKLSSARSVR